MFSNTSHISSNFYIFSKHAFSIRIIAKYGGETEYGGKLESPKPSQRKIRLPKTAPSNKRLSPLSVFIIGERR